MDRGCARLCGRGIALRVRLTFACVFLCLLGQAAYAYAGLSPGVDFDNVLSKTTSDVLKAHVRPSISDKSNRAVHKQQLAARVVQAIQEKTGFDEVTTIGSLGLNIAAVVWSSSFKPGYEKILTFGNHNQRLPPYKDVEYGAAWYCKHSTYRGSKYIYIPGLGSPCRNGGSISVVHKPPDGDGMSCMVFYAPMPRRQDMYQLTMASHQEAFQQAINACHDKEVAAAGIVGFMIANHIDLDRIAACVQQECAAILDHESNRQKHIVTNGVAAVATFSDSSSSSSSATSRSRGVVDGTERHENYGICAPTGFILLEHMDFDVFFEGFYYEVDVYVFAGIGHASWFE